MSISSRSSSNPPPRPKESTSLQSPPPHGKRKRSVDDENHELTVKAPAKRKKSKKAKLDEDENLDLKKGLNLAIGKLDSRLLADYVAQRTKRFSTDLSLVELEDRHIPGIFGSEYYSRSMLIFYVELAYHDTSSWERSRTLQDIPDFLDRYSSRAGGKKSLSSVSKQSGSPHTLVMTSAGLRAADITRYVTYLLRDGSH